MKTSGQLIKTSLIFVFLCIFISGLALPAAADGEENAAAFVFDDTEITVTQEGAGYEIKGTTLTIKESGTYRVSGQCQNGAISVKKGTQGVTLVLAGLSLTSADTAPVTCGKNTEVRIEAEADSINTLQDSPYNNDETHPDNANAENAVIKAKDGAQLTLCGAGELDIFAYGKNGIKGGASSEESEAFLAVEELTLRIVAEVNDGLKCDQELKLTSGDISVTAADDAIKSELLLNIGEENGRGPTLRLEGCQEGAEAAIVNIYGGDITIVAANDGINASNNELNKSYPFACNICGGNLYIDVSTGDGIDSNGTLTISGGTMEIHSAAQGNPNAPLDSEKSFTLTGGTVLAVGSYGIAQVPNSAEQAYLAWSPMGRLHTTMTPIGILQGNFNAASPLKICDEAGNALCETETKRTANFVFFSSPELAEGASYTLIRNDVSVGTVTATTAGADASGGFGGGGGTGGGGGAGGGGNSGGGGDVGGTTDEPALPGGASSETEAENPFVDVEISDYYGAAVRWAVANGITTGLDETHFGPEETCTRAQFITFLWRAAGMPEMPVDISLAFDDIGGTEAFYYKAVLWAVANGITNGTGTTTFSPDATVTRAEAVTMLFRCAGTSAYGENPFSDVADSAYYRDAVLWAVETGVTTGMGEHTFSPDAPCTRGQAVTFLYRCRMEETAAAPTPLN